MRTALALALVLVTVPAAAEELRYDHGLAFRQQALEDFAWNLAACAPEAVQTVLGGSHARPKPREQVIEEGARLCVTEGMAQRYAALTGLPEQRFHQAGHLAVKEAINETLGIRRAR